MCFLVMSKNFIVQKSGKIFFRKHKDQDWNENYQITKDQYHNDLEIMVWRMINNKGP